MQGQVGIWAQHVGFAPKFPPTALKRAPTALCMVYAMDSLQSLVYPMNEKNESDPDPDPEPIIFNI